jgi:predicted HAD superfamily Cof-like phosphohydrolase
MNDLSNTITGYLQIRDLIRDHYENPKVMDATVTLLELFIEQQETAFNKAWAEVIVKPNTIQDKKYAAQYTDEELAAMCDRVELDEENLQQSKEQIYKNYRAAIDEYNKLNVKYKELTACHMELQDLFYRVDGELDELKVSYDQCQSNYKIVVKALTDKCND